MTYYIIKSGSIQDIKTAKEILAKMPDDLRLPYFLLECDDNGNVIREVGGDEKENKGELVFHRKKQLIETQLALRKHQLEKKSTY